MATARIRPVPTVMAARLVAALLLGLALLAALPARGAAQVTDPLAVQDLARAETLITLGDYDAAVEILKSLAGRGFALAAVRLADLLYDEIAVATTPPTAAEQRATLDLAIDFYRQAASVDGSHYDQASRRLARLLLLRGGDSEAVRAAVDQLRRLIVLGSGPAAYDLGGAYLFGRGVPQDQREAERFLTLALDMGNFDAARLLGHIFANGVGRPVDLDEAVRYLQMAVEHGDPRAARSLASVYGLMLGDREKAIAASGAEIEILQRQFAAEPQAALAMRLAELHLRDPFWPQDLNQGVAWLTRAADADETGLAAFRLFQFYGEPSYGAYDKQMAADYARRAAEAGYWDAIPGIGHYFLNRACEEPDMAALALEWLQQAAEGGHADSMNVLGLASSGTWPCVAGAPGDGLRWRLAAAQAGWGNNDEVLDLGNEALRAATDDATRETGLALLEVAAGRGSVAAKTDLGAHLVSNAATDAERARGIELLREAAVGATGTRAMVELAEVFLYSADPDERAEAFAWLQRAGGYGRPEALRILGRVYLEGMIVPRDVARAEEALGRALAYGDSEAGLDLADLYLAGIGGTVDLDRARAAIETAAELGSTDAMLRLSEMYRFGIGVDVQPELAQDLLDKAAAAGNPQAQMLREASLPLQLPSVGDGPAG